MRQLSEEFIDDLKSHTGILKPLMQFILNDDSLEFIDRKSVV